MCAGITTSDAHVVIWIIIETETGHYATHLRGSLMRLNFISLSLIAFCEYYVSSHCVVFVVNSIRRWMDGSSNSPCPTCTNLHVKQEVPKTHRPSTIPIDEYKRVELLDFVSFCLLLYRTVAWCKLIRLI